MAKETLKGFTLHINNTNYLFVTPAKTKTKGLVQKVRETLQSDENLTPTILYQLRSKLTPAEVSDTTGYKVVNTI